MGVSQTTPIFWSSDSQIWGTLRGLAADRPLDVKPPYFFFPRFLGVGPPKRSTRLGVGNPIKKIMK
jgi:hypothetical protein